MTDSGGARGAPPCLALDIGATKVEAAIVLADGSLTRRDRFNVADHATNLLESIVTLARSRSPKVRSEQLAR